MDFLEDLWILLLLPLSLLLSPSTPIHCNICRNSKYEKGPEDLQGDKLSSWGPMGAVGLVVLV